MLIEAAIKVFMRVGYRRAQVADIAHEMGVAPGTVYLYVESKEALFDIALQRAFGRDPQIDPERLPVPAPSHQQILSRIAAEFSPLGLEKAGMGAAGESAIEAELTELFSRLYDAIHLKHRGIGMIEASAHDWPELFELFYGVRRELIRELTEYLNIRIGQGLVRNVPDTRSAARLILETISWFAYHRTSDPEPASVSEVSGRATVVDMLVHALLLE